MFNPFSPPDFALAGVSPSTLPKADSALPSRVQAMLGRGLGRGAVPGSAPGHHAAPSHSEPSNSALAPEFLDYVEAMGQNIAFLREQIGEMRGELSTLSARGADSAKVFDVLHGELGDYKRDFIFAHIKPLLRPLLFLYDSLESFDGEMSLYEEVQSGQNLPSDALKGAKVRGNIAFLRDQLLEALSVCEVEPMAPPSGRFDAHFQKAIQTAAVEPELDGIIMRVIRIGWTLHGQILRPAEVVVGKSHHNSPGGHT